MFGFSIREILPHIYWILIDSPYELAMFFIRVQEYYESPKFHKKIFSLVDYMEWYAEEHGKGAFTYPKDWTGFNVPSWALRDIRTADIPDPNKYDQRLFTIIDWVEDREEGHDYYFIGTSLKGDALEHEIAHALYTVNPEYRAEVIQLLNQWEGPADLGKLPGPRVEELDNARRILKEMGYHPSTIEDEIHAYCATGFCKRLKGVISPKEWKPFKKLFEEYHERCKNDE